MKYSQIFYLLLVIVWIFAPLTLPYKIMYLGFIALYLAVHNLIGLKLAKENKTIMRKYDFMCKKFGSVWGPRIYTILFIFVPLALGIYVVISSFMILFA